MEATFRVADVRAAKLVRGVVSVKEKRIKPLGFRLTFNIFNEQFGKNVVERSPNSDISYGYV